MESRGVSRMLGDARILLEAVSGVSLLPDADRVAGRPMLRDPKEPWHPASKSLKHQPAAAGALAPKLWAADGANAALTAALVLLGGNEGGPADVADPWEGTGSRIPCARVSSSDG